MASGPSAPVWRVRRGLIRCSRPTPRNVTPSSSRLTATTGGTSHHFQASVKKSPPKSRASRRMAPQLARLGSPSPRKASPASKAMARPAAPTSPATRINPTSGRMWRRRIWPDVPPKPTAALMCARRRSDRTWDRTMRAVGGHPVRAMISADHGQAGPGVGGDDDEQRDLAARPAPGRRSASARRRRRLRPSPATMPTSAPMSSVPPPGQHGDEERDPGAVQELAGQVLADAVGAEQVGGAGRLEGARRPARWSGRAASQGAARASPTNTATIASPTHPIAGNCSRRAHAPGRRAGHGGHSAPTRGSTRA